MESDVVLEIYEYAVASQLSDSALVGVKARTFVERAAGIQARAVVTTFTVPGNRLAEYRYPRDWWQALKGRFAPQWALRRWPAREIVVEARALYPMLKIPDTTDSWATIRFEEHDWRHTSRRLAGR